LKRLKKPKLEEDESAPGQRSGLDAPNEAAGYRASDRSGMRELTRAKAR
jgi:hypothetical protein